MDRRVFVATLLLSLLGSAFAQEPPAPDASDLVILLDVSSSMRRRDAFDRARRLIDGLADEAVRPGAHVALVPFGTGVHEVQRFDAPGDEAGTADARARLRTALAEIRTRDSYSYLGEALDTGLRLLAEFKASDPRRTRHLVLISDGLQSVASRDTPLSLPDVLARWAAQGLRAPDDYVVWYAYIRKSEPELVSAIERTGAGRVAAIDRLEGLKWTFTRIETATADLGAKRTGSWTARVPFVATSGGGAESRWIVPARFWLRMFQTALIIGLGVVGSTEWSTRPEPPNAEWPVSTGSISAAVPVPAAAALPMCMARISCVVYPACPISILSTTTMPSAGACSVTNVCAAADPMVNSGPLSL